LTKRRVARENRRGERMRRCSRVDLCRAGRRSSPFSRSAFESFVMKQCHPRAQLGVYLRSTISRCLRFTARRLTRARSSNGMQTLLHRANSVVAGANSIATRANSVSPVQTLLNAGELSCRRCKLYCKPRNSVVAVQTLLDAANSVVAGANSIATRANSVVAVQTLLRRPNQL